MKPESAVLLSLTMNKTTVIHALKNLPEEFPTDELMERLIIAEKFEVGLNDVRQGNTLDHNTVKKMVRRWKNY